MISIYCTHLNNPWHKKSMEYFRGITDMSWRKFIKLYVFLIFTKYWPHDIQMVSILAQNFTNKFELQNILPMIQFFNRADLLLF